MKETAETDLSAAREHIAQACRVLASRGLSDGFLGHISLRVGAEHMLIRCRGPHERGLAWTDARDVRLVTLDGSQGSPGELDAWSPPSELPLHAEVLRNRSDVEAVVHAHPPAVVAADLAGLGIRPIIGAFDIPGAKLAAGGVPVYPRSALIRSKILAREMLDAMAERPVVVLRGHGVTATGGSVVQAVLRVLSLDMIARMSLTVASAGGTLRDISDEDMAELPDLGSSLNLEIAWRHELSRLGHDTKRVPCL